MASSRLVSLIKADRPLPSAVYSQLLWNVTYLKGHSVVMLLEMFIFIAAAAAAAPRLF